MNAIEVTFPGGMHVDAAVGHYVVRTDQPSKWGGGGSAPDPFELFLAALATCMGAYVLGFCQSRGIPTSGMRLVQETTVENGKPTKIAATIHLPASFPEKYVRAVRTAAGNCSVAQMLALPPSITIEVARSG